MTELSATATAILKAYEDSPWEYHNADHTAIAAVLRAVAEVNVGTDYQNGKRVATILRSDILAIATELEEEASQISL